MWGMWPMHHGQQRATDYFAIDRHGKHRFREPRRTSDRVLHRTGVIHQEGQGDSPFLESADATSGRLGRVAASLGTIPRHEWSRRSCMKAAVATSCTKVSAGTYDYSVNAIGGAGHVGVCPSSVT